MNKAHEIGHQGEATALYFLACKKHNILERNWRWKKPKSILFLKMKYLSFC